jgi:hypothetical protein
MTSEQYGLEYSIDGQHWRTVPEKRTYSDCPGTGIRNVPVTRSNLSEIQREAEFWSHRYPHVRINHPISGAQK